MRFAACISAALMPSAVATPAMSQPLAADAGFGFGLLHVDITWILLQRQRGLPATRRPRIRR